MMRRPTFVMRGNNQITETTTQARELASSLYEFTGQESEIVLAYIESLLEPQRTYIKRYLEGELPPQIARAMGVRVQDVCREMAKVYAALRVKLG